MVCSLLLLAFVALPHAATESTSPISKVLTLLSDLQTKIIGEGEAAQKEYAEYSEWCEERSKNLAFEIKTGKHESAELSASIESYSSTMSSLSAKIEMLAGDIATDEADLKAATVIRGKEAADFAAAEKELMETVDTLERAIGLLERHASMLQVKNAGTLAQALSALVQASAFNSADAAKLTALVQSSQTSDSDEESLGAPAASLYEGHSGGIVDTLQDLLEKAEAQLTELRKTETADLHNFQMLKQSIEDELTYGNKELVEAKKGSAAASEKKASSQGDLSATSKELGSDVDTLEGLHKACMDKAQDYEAEVKSRGEELKALAAAKKAIAANTAGATTLSYGLNQMDFLQLKSHQDLANFEVVRFVRELAHKQKSTSLSQLALRMATAMHSADPFSKVKGLIGDMIDRLEKEAEADATEKAYCDKELSETEVKKADKTDEITKLTTKIDEMTARSGQLKEEVAALEKALSELAGAQAEMDKLRKEENEAFTSGKADMEQGLQGVKLALKVLTEYYANEDKSHTAAEGAGGGIIGLLEVIESDFSKGLAEMTATEQEAVDTYTKLTKENEIDKTTKEQDVKYKSKESGDLDKATSEASSDRSGVQAELDAVMEYLAGLHKRCIVTGGVLGTSAESYDERKRRREAEMVGLKEALTILEEQTALIQRSSHSSLLRGVQRHLHHKMA